MLHSKIIPINLFPVNLNGIFKGKWLYFPIEHTQLSEGTPAPNCSINNIPCRVLPSSRYPLLPFTTIVVTPPLLHSRLNVWTAA